MTTAVPSTDHYFAAAGMDPQRAPLHYVPAERLLGEDALYLLLPVGGRVCMALLAKGHMNADALP